MADTLRVTENPPYQYRTLLHQSKPSWSYGKDEEQIIKLGMLRFPHDDCCIKSLNVNLLAFPKGGGERPSS